MKHDNRFAPNPLFGVLTLATCKPAMRRNTKIGNWIAGWTSKQLKDSPTEVGKEKLIYLAKVTQKLSFAEYWEKYEQKRPVKTEDTKVIQRYGDNIYKPNPTNPKEFIQIENNFHGKDKMDKDLRGEYVLICEEFYYFSRLSPLDIPCLLYTSRKVRKEEVSTFITSPCITRHNIPPKTNKNVKKMALRTAEFRICSVSRLSFLLNAKIINKHPAIINNFVHSL